MSAFIAHKVVASLPGTLTPSTLYCVRAGAGFDLYLTNESGQIIAYPLNGGGGSAPDEADPLVATVLRDDFITQSTETGEVGRLNWSFTNGSIAALASEQNHPGIQRRTTSTTANQVASMYLGATATTPICRFDEFDEMTWVLKNAANGITDLSQSWGAASAFSSLSPAHGFMLEAFNTDTNWNFTCRNGSVSTRVDTGVSCRTLAWAKVKMRRVATGQMAFSINGAAEVNITTNVPDDSDLINIGQMMAPTTTTARSVDLDFFSLKLRPVIR